MEFCMYINTNPFPAIAKPLSTGDFNEALQGNEWFIDFVNKMDKDEVFAIGLAANAMEVPELLDLISCKIACLTYGKSVEEMRAVFGITNDFTPQESEAIRAEVKMAEDFF